PKISSADAVLALKSCGVDVKILTGDNEILSKIIASKVNIHEKVHQWTSLLTCMTKELGTLLQLGKKYCMQTLIGLCVIGRY
ncbi:hypothetical protein OC709_02660, partial ['Planchonia careya' phytoplasma]